jgi:hypothetical protein
VRPAGVKPVDPLTSLKHTFETGRDYTVVVGGTPEKVDRSPFVLVDDNKTPIAPGKTRIRMVHASLEASNVEICVDEQCEILAYGGVTRGGEVGGYITLDAGPQKITLRQIDAEEFYVDVLPLTFESGEVYSIFILDPKQGEVRPRIIPHADTGHHQPWVPDGPPAPWPGGSPGQPPLYPPVTGTFLSPTALSLILVLGLTLVGGCCWLAWRHFVKA